MAYSLTKKFLTALSSNFPADFISTDAADLIEYGRDWTRVFNPAPSAIALPRTTAEVSKLLGLCNTHKVPVVPSGGRTGLAAGAVAKDGELVISLERMRRLDAVDSVAQSLRVQAGVVTELVHQHCADHKLTWPIDFAAKGQCQIGGNIATNAGGVKVIRYGLTRQWVLGLQVVLADGTILELNGALEKNNTGFDLRQLFIGTEGTLGIITEATLKLTRLPNQLNVALFALPDLAAVLLLFHHIRQSPFTIAAFEFFNSPCLDRVQRHRHLAAPFSEPAPYYVLLELENVASESLENWLMQLFENELVQDGTLAQSETQARNLWALREGISDSLTATGLPHKNDVALPIANLEGFCDELAAVLGREYPGWEITIFGHIGDGNLHINVMKPDELAIEEFQVNTAKADHHIFTLVQKHNGSISAEHGIGLLKKPYLTYTRTDTELSLLRSIKRTLDPLNILNPGKIFDI
ncbi:MAG: FAD-binding oxidoreductase [Deltaproteobacteria bacterium]|nr:FAD-binding oxidoreductase [Deltaproteobacteria bacterium]